MARDMKQATNGEVAAWRKGENWGRYVTDRGIKVTMLRRRQRVRFYTDKGRQIGPEQANVVPAIAYTMAHKWEEADR